MAGFGVVCGWWGNVWFAVVVGVVVVRSGGFVVLCFLFFVGWLGGMGGTGSKEDYYKYINDRINIQQPQH